MLTLFQKITAFLGFIIIASTPASAALVNIAFSPPAQTVQIGDIVEINLIVSSNGAAAQPFAALDAIIGYDSSKLVLLDAIDDHAGASFFVQGFLPDPDGINANIADGEALFTALAPPGQPAPAPAAPAQLIVTTFRFFAVGESANTVVFLKPQVGVFGKTRVLLNGSNITGDISGTASVTILPVQGACCLDDCRCIVTDDKNCGELGGTWKGPDTDCGNIAGIADVCESCLGDVDLNGSINVDDLLLIINSWGPPPPGGCHADIDNNSAVDVDDLLIVINNWGTCP